MARFIESVVRMINEDGEVACKHRDLSVCDKCFAATPGLVSVYAVVYLVDIEDMDWIAEDKNVFTSPGTRP